MGDVGRMARMVALCQPRQRNPADTPSVLMARFAEFAPATPVPGHVRMLHVGGDQNRKQHSFVVVFVGP